MPPVGCSSAVSKVNMDTLGGPAGFDDDVDFGFDFDSSLSDSSLSDSATLPDSAALDDSPALDKYSVSEKVGLCIAFRDELLNQTTEVHADISLPSEFLKDYGWNSEVEVCVIFRPPPEFLHAEKANITSPVKLSDEERCMMLTTIDKMLRNAFCKRVAKAAGDATKENTLAVVFAYELSQTADKMAKYLTSNRHMTMDTNRIVRSIEDIFRNEYSYNIRTSWQNLACDAQLKDWRQIYDKKGCFVITRKVDEEYEEYQVIE